MSSEESKCVRTLSRYLYVFEEKNVGCFAFLVCCQAETKINFFDPNPEGGCQITLNDRTTLSCRKSSFALDFILETKSLSDKQCLGPFDRLKTFDEVIPSFGIPPSQDQEGRPSP